LPEIKNLYTNYTLNEIKNNKDYLGNTPLYLAVKLALKNNNMNDLIKILTFLLKNGANPKIRNNEGWCPLDEAIFHVKFIIY
jgi:ankyrin repeat protein